MSWCFCFPSESTLRQRARTAPYSSVRTSALWFAAIVLGVVPRTVFAQEITETEASAGSTAPAPVATTRTVATFRTSTSGIDPVVGDIIDRELQTAAQARGYQSRFAESSVNPANNSAGPAVHALTPYELWHLTATLAAERGMQARVWAADGLYVVEVVVASMDRTGPFFGRDTAQASDLRSTVARLVQNTLPAPDQWQGDVAALQTSGASAIAPSTLAVRPSSVRVLLGDPRTGSASAIAARDRLPFRRFSVALQTEASIGVSTGGFYNHFVGLRFDARLTRDISIGIYAAYANLEGRNSRENNFAFALYGEDRIRFSARLPLVMPLRVALGYLPFNGPTLRLSAGVGYLLSDAWEIGLDVLVPTFYFLSDRIGVGFNPAIELIHRF